MATEKKEQKLKASKRSFTLIGEVKIGQNAFPAESVSKTTGYVSKKMNLGVKVNEGYAVYCEGFGGFAGRTAPLPITAYSKKNDGSKYEIQWEDRLTLDAETFNDISNMSLITVGLEMLENGNVFYKSFLSMYDAIPYIQEHLPENARVKIKGKLTPNVYNGKTTLKKEVTYIALYDGDEENCAKGQISVLVSKDSLGKSRLKQDGEFDVSARFISYAKEVNGVEVKKNIPFDIELVLPTHADGTDIEKQIFKYIANMFNTKKKGTVNEVGFEVIFEEGNLIQEATVEDLDAESRAIIDMGLMSEEEVLGKLTVKGGRINRIVIAKPMTVKEEVDGKMQLRVLFEEGVYTEEELALPEKKEDTKSTEVTEEEATNLFATGAADADTNWLNAIMQ